MKMTDVAAMGSTRVTDEGYLYANVRTARTGVQSYLGAEMGRPDLPLVNVYRDEAEVFRKASLNTFALLPVTDDHPADLVSSDTAKAVSVGTTNEEVLRDGEFLKIGIKITDAATVQKVVAGKRELSVGYTSEIIWGDGIAPDGTPYQARQTNIVGNHIAIVAAGRAGPMARIGDGIPDTVARWGASPIYDGKDTIMADAIQTRTVLIDGLSVVTTDAGAQALEKLQRQIADAQTAMTGSVVIHAAEIAAKDAEIAKAEAARDDAKGKVMTDADIDKRVQDRADLIAVAKSVHPEIKTAGLSDAAIRKSVVAAKLGDAITGKSDAYIDVRFDILAEDAAKADPFADGMKDRKPAPVTSLDAVYAERNASLNDAWKTPAKKEA